MHVFLWLVLSQKIVISYPKNISDVNKGEAKLLNDLKVWNQEEKIYQQGCVELQHTNQVK